MPSGPFLPHCLFVKRVGFLRWVMRKAYLPNQPAVYQLGLTVPETSDLEVAPNGNV